MSLWKGSWPRSTCYRSAFLLFEDLFIFRERGREGEREGEREGVKHQCETETLISCLSLVPWHVPLSQGNPGMGPDQEWNWQPFGLQDYAQPTDTPVKVRVTIQLGAKEQTTFFLLK